MALPRNGTASRSVVLVTDGYIEAEADVFDYIRAQLDDANVFAFGIGTSVNRLLIEGVARAGLGEPFVVTAPGEAAEAAARFRRYIETPVLTGIDVAFNGFDAYDVEPGQVPDLFAEPPDRRLRQVARARRRIDRDLGPHGARRVPDVDSRLTRERRQPPRRASVSVGPNPDCGPLGLRSGCADAMIASPPSRRWG